MSEVETKKERPLNIRQLKFADAILQGKTQREAYVLAGYKAKTENVLDKNASILVNNGKVNRYITIKKKEVADKAEKKLDISREKVLKMLLEVAERCNQDITPMLDRKGNQIYVEDKDGKNVAAFIFNAKGVVAALAELIKVQGYNAPIKIDASVDTGKDFDPSALPLDVVVEFSNLIDRVKKLKSLPAVSGGHLEQAGIENSNRNNTISND
jgi:phage terminase small subunit